jgi:exodeoxyribonuclease VII large subunit
LSSEEEILTTLDRLDNENYDLIAVSRGGGDNLDIFNRFTIAEKAVSLKSLFITAIGHKDDIPLLIIIKVSFLIWAESHPQTGRL